MIHLVYVSSATEDMSDDELVFLLKQSRERNKKQNVTGMLLYCGGNFIQVLEGASDDVEDVYESIVKDERNSGNILIVKRAIASRAFPNWSMGFKRLSTEDKRELEGFTEFLEHEHTPKELSGKVDGVINLLFHFKEGNR